MKLIRVPWLPGNRWAVTIAPFVLILSSEANRVSLIAHEQKHLDQIKEMGWLKWYWKYIVNLRFRREQEAEGYAIQREIDEGRKQA